MKRWAFNHLRWITNTFCLFSLLVFVSSVTLRVRSYFVGEAIRQTSTRAILVQGSLATRTIIHSCAWARGNFRFTSATQDIVQRPWMGSSGGRVTGRNTPVPRSRAPAATSTLHNTLSWDYLYWEPTNNLVSPPSSLDTRNYAFAGFQILRTESPPQPSSLSELRVVIPLWLFLLPALPSILWLRRWRKGRRGGFPVVENQTMIEER